MVDIVVLTRDGHVSPDVLQALRRQTLPTDVHVVVGRRKETDRNRWETISRARNRGRKIGSHSRVMFVDDDVILASDCVARLSKALDARPEIGAYAAQYLTEKHPGTRRHVGMGATLFRRQVLDRFPFRWEAQKCECQCMCDDLRAHAIGIEYDAGAKAYHISRPQAAPDGWLANDRGQIAATGDFGRF